MLHVDKELTCNLLAVFASPLPAPMVPANSLSTRIVLPCPLGEDCGPFPVEPIPPQKRSTPSVDCALAEGCGPIVVPPNTPPSGSESTVSLRSPAVCTEWVGPLPIGDECFTSGPYAGQCIPFYCLQRPDTCGCPGSPPPAAQT